MNEDLLNSSPLQVAAEAPITRVACENRHLERVPFVRAKVASAQLPVSQRNWVSRLENKISHQRLGTRTSMCVP